MKTLKFLFVLSLAFLITSSTPFNQNESKISDETQECINCHSVIHPGIVSSWEKSRHSKINPADAIKKSELERRVSFSSLKEEFKNVVVGCYECHSLNTDKHKDSFEHNGYKINVIVSPNDCAVCHPVEAEQYSKNLMSFAHTNLVENKIYRDLMKSVNNPHSFEKNKLEIKESNKLTEFESCLYCHGTQSRSKRI
jgi:hydroxylamine dehydrogenase